MSEATARAELYSELSKVIGVDNAGTLMSYLPGDEPATKTDLAATESILRAEMNAGFSELRAEMDARFSTVTARLDAFEVRMDRLEDKFDAQMEGFHTALLTQGRTYVLSSIGSILSTGALVTAITQAMS